MSTKFLRNTLTIISATLLLPLIVFTQSPPSLGSAASFALFTAAGAFNNTGASMITGDIGTNTGGPTTGFLPLGTGTVIGTIHDADPASVSAAADVLTAFSYLFGVTCGTVLGTPTLGGGQILTPDVYCIGSAATLTGDLILDASGDPDAIFIIKIGGAFSTAVNSKVILTGGASLCNVYWSINGAFALGENSVFRGTVLVNGAISLLEKSSLFGQALSRAGAISTHNNVVTIGKAAAAAMIKAEGSISFCEGDSVTLSGNVGGTWNTGATTDSIVVKTSGDYFVTNTNSCGVSNHINVVVSPSAGPTITASPPPPTMFCTGGSVTLTSSAALSYLWNTSDTTRSITVDTSGIYSVMVTTASCGGLDTSSFVVAFKTDVMPTITADGPTTFCFGESVILTSSAAASYLWSTSDTTRSITVDTSGSYSVQTGGVCTSQIVKIVVIPTAFCPPPPTQPIPTLGQWSLILLTLSLIIIGVTGILNRVNVKNVHSKI